MFYTKKKTTLQREPMHLGLVIFHLFKSVLGLISQTFNFRSIIPGNRWFILISNAVHPLIFPLFTGTSFNNACSFHGELIFPTKNI